MPDPLVQTCPNCQQKLRVPGIADAIRVTCPRCRTSWEYQAGQITNLKSTRPYSLAVGLICVLLSLLAGAGTYGFVAEAETTAERIRARNDIQTVQATITGRSSLHQSGVEWNEKYRLRVLAVHYTESFSYRIDGHEYRGTRKDVAHFSPEATLRNRGPTEEGQTWWRNEVTKESDRFLSQPPEGSTVKVYYRPTLPAEWHLDAPEPEGYLPWYFLIALAVVSGVLTMALTGFAYRFLRSVGKLKSR